MRTKRRILKALLVWSILQICVLGSFNVLASEYDPNKALETMVIVETYYKIGNETEVFLRDTQGILVGTEENGAEYVIVCATDVFAAESERQSFIEQKALDEEQQEKLQFVIEVVVGKDIYIEASVENYSEELDFAILKLEKSIFNKPPLIFNLDKDAVQFSEDIYVLDKISFTVDKGVMLAETQREETVYLQYKVGNNKNHRASMVINDKGEFMGFGQLSEGKDTFLALSAKEVALILKTLGVEFCVADHTDYSVNDTALQTAIMMAESIEIEGYTQDSVLLLQSVIDEGKTVLSDEMRTQEDVDIACEKLIQIQNELVVEDKLDPIAIVAIIVASFLFVTIIMIIIVMVCMKKKRQRIQREKAELERKKAPVNQGPYVPTVRDGKSNLLVSGNYYETGESENFSNKYSNVSQKLSQLKGFAPSSSPIVLNDDDTTVLGVEVTQNERINNEEKHISLINKNSGKEYTINKASFVIGKSVQKADLVLDNSSVSRVHAKIVMRNNEFYLVDINSLNGTFLNGIRLVKEEENKVKNGDVIKFSDEVFFVEIM